MGTDTLTIILPERQMDDLSDALVAITRAIDERDPELVAHGFLGGEHGYGAVWDCETFTMRPFYWGDCDCDADERSEAFWSVNEHTPSCYQTELRQMEIAAGVHYSQERDLSYEKYRAEQDRIYRILCAKHDKPFPAGCAVHCTCGLSEKARIYFAENGHRPTCSLELPNFLHKASGVEVRWYKYIGRDQEVLAPGPVDIEAIRADCLAAVANAPAQPQADREG